MMKFIEKYRSTADLEERKCLLSKWKQTALQAILLLHDPSMKNLYGFDEYCLTQMVFVLLEVNFNSSEHEETLKRNLNLLIEKVKHKNIKNNGHYFDSMEERFYQFDRHGDQRRCREFLDSVTTEQIDIHKDDSVEGIIFSFEVTNKLLLNKSSKRKYDENQIEKTENDEESKFSSLFY